MCVLQGLPAKDKYLEHVMTKAEVLAGKIVDTRESQWRLIWRAFRRHKPGMIGLIMLSLMILGVIFVPLLFPDPYQHAPDAALWTVPMGTVDPATDHVFWLGSDKFGRDNLALVFEAGRLSLLVAFAPTIIIVIIGSIIGAVAGYSGGWVDSLLMRVTDFLLALPLLPAYLVILRIIRPNNDPVSLRLPPIVDDWWLIFLSLIGMFVLFGWMGISRMVRGQVLSMRDQAFVEAARALGANTPHIIFRHLLPNSIIPILIAAMFMIGDFIILEAVLSYFGLGFRDVLFPHIVSWGNMLALNQDETWYMTNLNPFQQIQGYLVIFPSLLLFITVLSINYIGSALRDVLDPRTHAQA
jgi:peptide/nickel transport system permease protein